MEPIRRVHLQSEIIESIRTYIIQHGLEQGDKLPSQNEMAELLNVSRTSLREAMKTLEARNIIKVINGKGVYVNKASNMDFQSDIEMEREREILLDIVEVRRYLDKEMIRMVVKNATTEDYEYVEQKLNVLIKKQEAGEDTTKEDYEFHMSLYKITHNHAMERISNYMDKVFKRLWEYPLNMKEPFKDTMPLHKDLYIALKNKSRVEAERISNMMMDMLIKEIRNA